MNGPVCKWGDCDNQATRRVTFTSPAERVAYCGECVREVKRKLDWSGIKPL